MMSKRVRFAVSITLAALLAGLYLLLRPGADDLPRERVGLMTSLPIYWSETAEFAAFASGQGELPWVRAALEEDYVLQPLDTLVNEDGSGRESYDRLIIAQPRALSPQDNVALDEWVNNGGRLLLVIDPLLTGNYSVPLGHPSHPMAVGLLPPVLERWGIGVRYDENQPFALRTIEADGFEIPVAMAGEAHLLGSGFATCDVSHEGVLARCDVGRGRVTLLADAALFEFHQESADHRKLLSKLTNIAFE
jgi:hypothetical protein